jgi:hypothetical protein
MAVVMATVVAANAQPSRRADTSQAAASTSPVTTPTATLMTSRVPKNRVSRS